MKEILFGCIGAGIAVVGAFFLYKKWQKCQNQCLAKSNEPTLEKSRHFVPNFEVGMMKRNRLCVCVKETNGDASNGGETETTNVLKTEDLDCQICHAESLKNQNALTKNDKPGHDVQSDQDLPLKACNNTSNMSDASSSNFEPNFVKLYLKGTDIDLDAFYGEMNEYFTSLSTADSVSHTDREQTTVGQGQTFQAGPSSYSSSPSTSGFQPNEDGTKRDSKQLANRRHSSRKDKTN